MIKILQTCLTSFSYVSIVSSSMVCSLFLCISNHRHANPSVLNVLGRVKRYSLVLSVISPDLWASCLFILCWEITVIGCKEMCLVPREGCRWVWIFIKTEHLVIACVSALRKVSQKIIG